VTQTGRRLHARRAGFYFPHISRLAGLLPGSRQIKFSVRRRRGFIRKYLNNNELLTMSHSILRPKAILTRLFPRKPGIARPGPGLIRPACSPYFLRISGDPETYEDNHTLCASRSS
jgi:hypothetical protein